MAAGSSGQDEVVRLGVETSVKGVKESIDSLKDLSKQLSAIDKQLRSGLNVQGLSEKFSALAKDFEKVSKSVSSGTSDSSKSIDNLTNRVKALNAEVAKAQKQSGIGFIGDSKDKAKVQAYQQKLDSVGVTIMGGAKTVGMMVSNQRRLNEAFKSTALTGMATRASIDAVTEGGKVAFMEPIKRADQFKLQLSALRKDLLNVTQTMQSAAKDRQWIGRQMIEGITLPIAGIGTVAVRSFMAVQSEMIQLKKVTEFGAGTKSADAFYDSLVNGANGIREMSREFGVSRKSATALFKEVAALGVDGEQNIKDFANAVSEVSMVGEVDTSTAMQFFRTMNAIFVDGETSAQGLAKTRNLMAQMSAVADETSLQLNDLAAAFPEVAPVMDQMGFSAAGVAASLAGMYKRGIPATEAAHGLKFALQRLVSPTKDSQELIDKMGFSFFDAAGNVKKADLEIMAMAKNLEEGMSAEQASKALGELFGLRQSARMKSFFQDVNIGRRELEQFSAGTLKAAELTSDYARGLVAAGFGAENATGPMDRYNKALEEIKKDPTTGLKRLRAAFDDFKVQLGATIAPAVLTVGEQLTKLLDLFTNLPKSVQIAAVGFAGFIAALGPIRFAAAQATHAIASLGQVGAMFLPRMGEIISSQARLLTAGGPGAVMQVGDKFASKLSRMDRLRTKFGLKTSVEKAAQTVAGGSALAPETAATASLTSAKRALEAASVQVAAAEAAETAAHNSNTAAMTAQAAVMNKGAGYKPGLGWVDLNKTKGNIISYAQALELMTEQQKAAHYASMLKTGYIPPAAIDLRAQKMSEQMISNYDDLIVRAKKLDTVNKQNAAFDNLRAKAKQLAPDTGSVSKMSKLKNAFTSALPAIGLLSLKLVAIGLVIAAVAAVVYAFTKAFRDNWDAFVKKLQPGIEAIKKAFGEIKKAIGEMVKVFSDIFGQLGSGTDETGRTASAVEGVGETLSKIFEAIAKGMEITAEIIRKLKPVIEFFAYYFKDMVGYISALISGDYSSAMRFMAAATYEMLRPILMITDAVAKAFAQAISTILSTISNVFSQIPDPTGIIGRYTGKLSEAQSSIEEFSDVGFIPILDEKLRTLGGIFGDAADNASGDANDAGQQLGADLGNGINDGLAGAADGASWLKEWVSAVYNAMDEEINRVKESATRAMQNAHDAALKVYDERIKAIEDQESAEQKLFKTEEYLQKKRELLNKRQLDKENYLKERALAIYEGRFNDARILDLEERKSKQEYTNSLGDLESERSNDLIKEQRELAKEQIRLQKDAAQERFRIEADLLKAFLDEIFRYKPATVGEFQSMLDQVNVLLGNAGISWPDYATKAMERFQSVFAVANRNIVEDFRKSGQDSITAWMAGAISPEAKAIIEAGLKGGGGSSGVSSGSAGPNVGAPDLSFLNTMQKERPLELTAAFSSKVNLEKMMLKGQFEAGIISADQYKEKLKRMNDIQKEFTADTIPKYVEAIKNGNVKVMGEIERTIKGSISTVDEFGNKWTATSSGLVNQFGQIGKVVYDESGKIIGITNITTGEMSGKFKNTYDEIKLLAINAGKTIGNTTVQSSRLATEVLKEMTDKGIRPGSEEAAKYEQRIKGLGYQVSIVNGKSVLIPLEVDDTDAKAKVGRMYRLISEMNLEIAKDPDTPFYRKPIAYAKALFYSAAASSLGFASGGIVKAQKDGILANIGEGGFDEYVITTDPKYRASNLGYLAAAASKLGVKMASGAAIKAASGGMFTSSGAGGSSAEYAAGMGGDVYINVDTFIGEEQWFAEMANKYNMKTVPRQRKIEGQQKRVVSSYNDRYRLR